MKHVIFFEKVELEEGIGYDRTRLRGLEWCWRGRLFPSSPQRKNEENALSWDTIAFRLKLQGWISEAGTSFSCSAILSGRKEYSCLHYPPRKVSRAPFAPVIIARNVVVRGMHRSSHITAS